MLLRFFLFLAAAVALPGQQAPPSILAEAVPPVPRDLVRRLSPYRNFRSAGFSSWHPTRREMLIQTRFGDTTQVHLVQSPGGMRRQVTFFQDPAVRARFSPAGKDWFLFQMDEGGSEFFQTYRFDLATGKEQLVTDGKSRNGAPLFSNSGGRIAFSSTRRNGRDMDIYVMNPEDPASAKMVYETSGAWSPADWSPDDSKLLLVNFRSVSESYLHVLNIGGGKTAPVFPAGAPKASYSDAAFSRDGKGLYLITDRGSEFERLCYLELASGRLDVLTSHIPWDIEGFDLRKDGSMLAFVANEHGYSKLHLMNTATGKELPLPKTANEQMFSARFHPTLPELAFVSPAPNDVYSYNWQTGRLSRWTYSETGGLDASQFPREQLIHYPTFDKVGGKPRMIPAFIKKPPQKFKPPYPVLITIHGGPEGQSRPGSLTGSFYGNELGIAEIKPNVRGSSGYGKTYLSLDNADKREDSVRDIGALLDWIAAQPDLDAKRVAVTGGSYGGYMTLASLVHYSNRLRGGIDVVGISNWVTFLNNTQAYRRDLRRAEYGDERDPKMRDYFETISPLNNAHKIQVPLLVVQGRNDPRVPVNESRQMVKKIRDQGGTVWYIEAADEGHGFGKKPNRDYQDWAAILFLEKYLLQ